MDQESLKKLKSISDTMKSAINSQYRKNTTKRILQGDILKDVEIPIFDGDLNIVNADYAAILSQDCDLNQDFNSREEYLKRNLKNNNNPSLNSKMIPSILLCPAYPAEQLREGNHLSSIGLPMNKISNPKKTPWKNILNNETPRYHYLAETHDEIEMPELILDFKRYYSVSRDYLYSIYSDCYCISLNELYREDLSNRFYNYHSRIGLP